MLCNEGITLKGLSDKNQLSLHKSNGNLDSQCLLTMCHKMVKSYRTTSVQTIDFLAMDVDSFYQINEQYDNNVGDILLRQIGEALFDSVQYIHDKNNRDNAVSFIILEIIDFMY